MMNDKDVGLYRKFTVMRVDGSSMAEGKHEHCEYFVLDWDHDPFIGPAVLAYAVACEIEYPELARELRERAKRKPLPYEDQNAIDVKHGGSCEPDPRDEALRLADEALTPLDAIVDSSRIHSALAAVRAARGGAK